MNFNVGRDSAKINSGMDQMLGFLGGLGAQPAGVAPAVPDALPVAAELPVAAAAPANEMLPAGEQAVAGAQAGIADAAGQAVEGGARGQGFLNKLLGTMNPGRLQANVGQAQVALGNVAAAGQVARPVVADAAEAAAIAAPKILPGDRLLALLRGRPVAAQVVEGGAAPVAERGAGFMARLHGTGNAAAAAHDAAPAIDIAGVLRRMGGDLRAAGEAPRINAGGLEAIIKDAGAAIRGAGNAGRVADAAAPVTLKGVLEMARDLRIKRIP